jgi:rod shape determining protein RodA
VNQRNPAISKGIDWSLVGIYLLLVAIGLTAIFAATYKEGDSVLQSFLKFKNRLQQTVLFFCDRVCACIIYFIDGQ